MRVDELLRQANNHEQSSALEAYSKWLLLLGDGTIDYAIPYQQISLKFQHQWHANPWEHRRTGFMVIWLEIP